MIILWHTKLVCVLCACQLVIKCQKFYCNPRKSVSPLHRSGVSEYTTSPTTLYLQQPGSDLFCQLQKNFFSVPTGIYRYFSEVWDPPRQKINHPWLGDKCLGRQKQLTTTFIIQTLTCSSGCILGTIILNIQHVQTSSCNCITAYVLSKVKSMNPLKTFWRVNVRFLKLLLSVIYHSLYFHT